jgi:ABC-type branched-subunit amino acid transport system ATPase component
MTDRAVIMQAQGVSVSFGGTRALIDASITVREGTVHGIAGANGSGKSTLLNVLSRIVTPQSGQLEYLGQNLLALPGHKMAHKGIGRAFQTPVLFRGLSVLDNVMVGFQPTLKASALKDLLRWPSYARSCGQAREQAKDLMASFGVDRRLWFEPVDKLNPGQQRRIELVRVLACQPKLLLLDEPAVGLASRELTELQGLLVRLAGTGVTIMLVEHNVGFLRGLADVITIMDHGAVLAEGGQNVFEDERVVAAYLGQPTGEDAELKDGER